MIIILKRIIKTILPIGLWNYFKKVVQKIRACKRYEYEYQTFSQAGEDCILRFLFNDMKIMMEDVSYLDIGICHPTSCSNTFLFYIHGAMGVLVEANERAIPIIRKFRERDKILNVGVSHNPRGGSAKLYCIDSGGSTLDKDEAEKRVKLGAKITEEIEIPLVSINYLIEENFSKYPVFLSLDVEGLDYSVLKTLDFVRFPIPVVCIETCSYSINHIRPKNQKILNFMKSKGYEVYADTYINTIFVNKKWFYTK